MIPLSFRLQDVTSWHRQPGFDSGWRSLGHTLMARVTGGRYEISTSESSVVVEDGMGFLVPAGLRHRVSVRGPDALVTSVLDFHCRVHEAHDLFSVLSHPVVLPRTEADRFFACHSALVALQARVPSIEESVEISAHLVEVVRIAVRRCPELERWALPERQRLLPALEYVRAHLAEPISHTDLARSVGVSPPHFHNLFTRAFGISPMALVRRERMQHARRLLHTSTLPVAEVARLCGYEDPLYFSRAFRRAEGVPPTRYRRMPR